MEIYKCPSNDEWINKMWSTHTMAYYLPLNRNEVLTHGTTEIDFESIVLSERPHVIQPYAYVMSRTGDSTEAKGRFTMSWFERRRWRLSIKHTWTFLLR